MKERLYKYLERVILLGLFVWGIVESGYGMMQVLGWRASGHTFYSLTGHFSNPGPFGGFVACVMAVAGAWLMRFRVRPGMTEGNPGMVRIEAGVKVVAWVALGMGILVLPASMSRAGWLALGVAIAIEAWHCPSVREWFREHRWCVPVCAIGVVALCSGAFLLKPDSALGRLHIWRMECRAIVERPWTGAGPGKGPWAYGEAQEAFFRANLETVSPAIVRVAGCPEYAFNEFLGLGVEYGLAGLVLSLLVVAASIAVLYKTGSPFAAGLTAWAVFACASYPLAVMQLRVLGAVFLLIAIVVGVMSLHKSPSGLLPLLAAVLLAGWMGFRVKAGMTNEKEDFRMVYAQGYALHQAGRYAESTELLERGARMSCDPMFEIIMGKNAEAMGENGQAEALYEKAHYMVPSRLYPLVRLMRLQIKTGRNEDALETAQHIVAMPVNDRHTGMVRLREETTVTMDSLQLELQMKN